MRYSLNPGRLGGVKDGAAAAHIDFDELFHRAPVADDRGGVYQPVAAIERGGDGAHVEHVGGDEAGAGCLDVNAPLGADVDPNRLRAFGIEPSAERLSDEAAGAGHCDCLPAELHPPTVYCANLAHL